MEKKKKLEKQNSMLPKSVTNSAETLSLVKLK